MTEEKPKPLPWPHPEHTPQDRDRFIAQVYRHAAVRTDPIACEALDRYLEGFGITWPFMDPKTSGADYLTRDDVAALAQVRPDTVSAWAARGYLERTPDGYVRGEVEAFLERERPHGRRQSAQRAAELDL